LQILQFILFFAINCHLQPKAFFAASHIPARRTRHAFPRNPDESPQKHTKQGGRDITKYLRIASREKLKNTAKSSIFSVGHQTGPVSGAVENQHMAARLICTECRTGAPLSGEAARANRLL